MILHKMPVAWGSSSESLDGGAAGDPQNPLTWSQVSDGSTRTLKAHYRTPDGKDLPVSLAHTAVPSFELTPGQKIRLSYLGKIHCMGCGKNVKKPIDGYCFSCFKTKAEADICIKSPHNCHHASGTCREPQWADQFCFQPHAVYISFTDKFKIGITRPSQMPTRWWDQGATCAAVIAQVPNRRMAGLFEKEASEWIADTSHWLKMLQKGNATCSEEQIREMITLVQEGLLAKERVQSFLRNGDPETVDPAGAKPIFYQNPSLQFLEYPVHKLPAKIQSLSFEKQNEMEGVLAAIKGQYLIFESGQALNVRRHEGYTVNWTLE